MSASELILHLIPSPYGIHWSSPRALTGSAIANGLSSLVLGQVHSIGHVHVEIRHPKRRVLTGMTVGSIRERSRTALVKQMGLGVLFHSFSGRLEPAQEVEQSLKKVARSRRLSTLRFLLNDQAADRLLQYYEEYQQNVDHLGYGFPCRPRYREGAGCSEFAISFMEVAGLLRPEFAKAWRNSCLVPESLIGNSARPVTFGKLLFSPRAGQWASSESEGRRLEFWDPDRMHQWVKAQARSPSSPFAQDHENSTPGLVVDARAWPASEEPIWKVS